jgi:DNA-directed RNA polymerase specialized sigma24 family protein
MISVDRIVVSDSLLEAARTGDTEAFREFILRSRAYAVRIGMACFDLRIEDAEDIAQEALWTLHQNINSITYPQAWLYSTVRRMALRLKTRRRRETPHPVEPVSPDAPIALTPIWDCFMRLSDRCRNLIADLLFLGHTERELAGLRRVHYATIHQRKRTCIGSLYDLYSGGDHEKRMLRRRRTPQPWRGRSAP